MATPQFGAPHSGGAATLAVAASIAVASAAVDTFDCECDALASEYEQHTGIGVHIKDGRLNGVWIGDPKGNLSRVPLDTCRRFNELYDRDPDRIEQRLAATGRIWETWS